MSNLDSPIHVCMKGIRDCPECLKQSALFIAQMMKFNREYASEVTSAQYAVSYRIPYSTAHALRAEVIKLCSGADLDEAHFVSEEPTIERPKWSMVFFKSPHRAIIFMLVWTALLATLAAVFAMSRGCGK